MALGVAFAVICAEVYIDHPKEVFSSKETRGLNMVLIFVLFFICGYIWSRSPRMRLGLRVTMFSLTWIVSEPISAITYKNFTELYLPVLITGVLSIFSVLVWPLTASRAFGANMSRSFSVAADMVDQAATDYGTGIEEWRERKRVSCHSPNKMEDPPPIAQSEKYSSLRRTMASLITMMTRATSAARHEVTLSYVPNSELEKFRPYFNEFQAWMGCGMGMQSTSTTLEYIHEWDEPLIQRGKKKTNTEDGSGDEKGNKGQRSSSDSESDDLEGFNLDERPSVPRIRFSVSSASQSGEKAPDPEPKPDPDVFEEKKEVPALEPFRAELSQILRLMGTVIDICRDSPPENPKGITSELLKAIHDGRRARDPTAVLAVLEKQKNSFVDALVSVRLEFNNFVVRRSRNFREQDDNVAAISPLDPGTPIASYAATPKSPFIKADPLIGSPRLFRTDMYSTALFAVSLFEIAYKTIDLFGVAERVLRIYMSHRYPHIVVSHQKWTKWLKSDDGVGLFQAQGINETTLETEFDHTTDEDRHAIHSIFDESHESNSYQIYARNVVQASKRRKVHVTSSGKSRPLLDRLRVYGQRITRLNSVLDIRLAVSYVFREIRKSKHVRFALKLATGVLLLFLPSMLPPSGTAWWKAQHGQWMVISYIWCLEASTGDSFRISVLRVFGTICGCILGLISWEISRGNRYGLAALIVISDLPPIILRIFSPYPPAGAVMGITVPIVALVPFLNKGTYHPGIIAVIRMYMICIGIVAALIVNIVVWPYHARVRLIVEISNTLNQLQTLYLSLARQMFYAGFTPSSQAKEKFKVVEQHIRGRIARCRALLIVMKNELSLVPKPINVLDEILNRLQILADLFVGLRISREHGLAPIRKRALWDVIDLRQEMVSCILLVLWIVGQSMITRARIPQFLPSARRALFELTSALALQHGELVEVPEIFGSQKHDWQRMFDAPPLKHFALDHAHDDDNLRVPSASHTPNTPDMITAVIEDRQRRDSIAKGKPTVPVDAPRRLQSLTTDSTVYVLVEHAIMEQIIKCLEELIGLTRVLLGEMRLIYPTNPLTV